MRATGQRHAPSGGARFEQVMPYWRLLEAPILAFVCRWRRSKRMTDPVREKEDAGQGLVSISAGYLAVATRKPMTTIKGVSPAIHRQSGRILGQRSQAHRRHKPFTKTLDFSRPPFAKWFVGGETTSVNAVDRHAPPNGRD